MKRWHTVFALACVAWLVSVAAAQAQALEPGSAPDEGRIRGAGCPDLIQNGRFEGGPSPWVVASNHQGAIISTYYPPSQPDPNSHYAAYLGGVNNADDSLSQTVNLPSRTLSLALGFWTAMTTDEPAAAGTHDTLDVSLYHPGGSLIADLIVPSVDNTIEKNLWQNYTLDLRAYSGQAVMIRFEARTDAQFPTSFFVDDVRLAACPASGWVYLPAVLRSH